MDHGSVPGCDCDVCYSNNSTSHLASVTHDTRLTKIGQNITTTLLFIIDIYAPILEIETDMMFDFAPRQL